MFPKSLYFWHSQRIGCIRVVFWRYFLKKGVVAQWFGDKDVAEAVLVRDTNVLMTPFCSCHFSPECHGVFLLMWPRLILLGFSLLTSSFVVHSRFRSSVTTKLFLFLVRR